MQGIELQLSSVALYIFSKISPKIVLKEIHYRVAHDEYGIDDCPI